MAEQTTPDQVTTPYQGPEVAIVVRNVAGVPQATVNVTFPTGGWELREDSSSVKEGVAVARLTFIGPAPTDMVTQSLIEKSWAWPAKEPITRAEVWVNVVRRGAVSGTPEYRLAARYPGVTSPKVAPNKQSAGKGTSPEPTTYRCGNETLRIVLDDERASVTLSDGSVMMLDRLKASAGNDARTFTNGRMTVVQEVDSATGSRVRFARGRMTPAACTRVE